MLSASRVLIKLTVGVAYVNVKYKYWSWTGAFIFIATVLERVNLDCRLISSKPDNALFIRAFSSSLSSPVRFLSFA
ncbi:hypothetical protein KCP71_18405 [Salmonella enterica subsp. enterica]|nr:hypothetical protein KCP71_18405 [Salmonella enterica subsp. enterica]